jgi:hypothetical protein
VVTWKRDKGIEYQGEVNRNKRRCRIERCRSYTGLQGFGSLVKYVKPDVIPLDQSLTDVFAHTLVL